MNDTARALWSAQNKTFLGAAVELIHSRLLAELTRRTGADANAGDEVGARTELATSALRAALECMTEPPPLLELGRAFELSAFELDVLLLSAAPELDAQVGATIVALEGERAGGRATWSLALAALPDAHWSAMLPDAALRFHGLLEPGPAGTGVVSQPLMLCERVLHWLLGVQSEDPLLRQAGVFLPLDEELVPSHLELAAEIARAWSLARGTLPIVRLHGVHAASLRAVAAASLRALGRVPWMLDPANAADTPGLARVLQRERVLQQLGLVVVAPEAEVSGPSAAAWLAGHFDGLVVACGGEAPVTSARQELCFEVPAPTASEQVALWTGALEAASSTTGCPLSLDDGSLSVLQTRFRFARSQVEAAVARALPALLAHTQAPEPRAVGGALLRGAVETCRASFAGLAQRIEVRAGWDDLVLDDDTRAALRSIVAHSNFERKVQLDWGFGERAGRGLGVSALLVGPSGTGKTSAAEVVAGELGLDLYRIDLSSLVSKYIGETEKNLRKVFDAADAGGAILLFDEADALFARRTEVRSSTDRYANLEVAYLLQRIESFEGVTLLTTNIADNIDQAFVRRLRFVVRFDFPDAGARGEIWRRAFPQRVPLQDLAFERLAQLRVSGAGIRNIALAAAYDAAERDEAISMAHLYRSARMEYRKAGQVLTRAELEGWCV